MKESKKKKTIIFVVPDLESGGAERVITTIANHLPRADFIPKIMLMRKEGPYLQLLNHDIEIIDLQVKRIRQSLMPMLNEIRKRKPDIVFSGFGEVNAYLSLFIKLFPKTKFIARETNVVSQHVTRKDIRFFYRFYNNYHRIICQSDDMKADLVANFRMAENKIVKINNPVDFEAIGQQLKDEGRPQSFDPTYQNVVAVGNLSARKGFDNLLNVFSFLKNQKIKLHILGDGRDKEILQKQKETLALNHVIFHGKQQNPYPFLQFADLFTLSSRYEGFPNVLLEAGACGTYALANDCPGGIREIIQEGINGEIADIEDHEEFAHKILDILSKQHHGAAIHESIKSRFSKEIIMKQYERVLANL